MRSQNSALLLGVLLIASGSGNAAALDERKLFGWGGNGGGHLTMFSKDHTGVNNNEAHRKGELAFIYGGGSNIGHINFLHSNGASSWVEKMSLDASGTLRVGLPKSKTCGGCKLAVNGSVYSTEVVVSGLANWPDYVFEDGYDLLGLDEVESFIHANGHLPGVPSSSDVLENGVRIGEMNAILLKKIEELTLHVISLKKEINSMQDVR